MDNKHWKILIVDDVEAIRTFVRLNLVRMGYEFVDTAEDAMDAKSQTQDCKYDLVFLDINLPNINGLAFLQDLKSQCPDTRVVMCSGNSSEENVKTALAAGADGFLVKPVAATNLQAILHRLS